MNAFESVDVVVIGMGPGGEEVAAKLLDAGRSVVGIEAGLVGGECPYWGCVPSKMMIRAANLLAETKRVEGMAGHTEFQPNWSLVAARIRDEATDNWDDTVAVKRFESQGGRFVRGRGRIVGHGRVDAGNRQFVAAHAIVVATGAKPTIPPIPGLAQTPYWTNHEAIAATHIPKSLIVLGGGAIGVELAQVFLRFGSAVTIIDSSPHLLASEEPEVDVLLRSVLEHEGAVIITAVSVDNITHEGSVFTIELDNGHVLHSEELLIATGRRSDLSDLGLESVRVDGSKGSLEVDDHMRAGDNLWAVGDVTGKGAFTHVALYQSRLAIASILGDSSESADYRAIPRVTFTDPEVGSVGMSESVARNSGRSISVGIVEVASTSRGWIHKPGNAGFIKLVADQDQGILIGATSAGPCGGEVLGLLTLAIYQKTPLSALRSMVLAYPTFHGGIQDALKNM
jgi:pyruvate/2-oxoglutarate dehydrogenase complex dihydrolipoamide dehydrogenase (E3) component